MKNKEAASCEPMHNTDSDTGLNQSQISNQEIGRDDEVSIISENTSKLKTTLNNELNNLKNILNDPEYYVYGYISELRNQIDLDREETKYEIDLKVDGLLKELDAYEAGLKKDLSSRINVDYYNELIKNTSLKLNEATPLELEETVEILKLEKSELERKIYSNNPVKYYPMRNYMPPPYGVLVSFFDCFF